MGMGMGTGNSILRWRWLAYWRVVNNSVYSSPAEILEHRKGHQSLLMHVIFEGKHYLIHFMHIFLVSIILLFTGCVIYRNVKVLYWLYVFLICNMFVWLYVINPTHTKDLDSIISSYNRGVRTFAHFFKFCIQCTYKNYCMLLMAIVDLLLFWFCFRFHPRCRCFTVDWLWF